MVSSKIQKLWSVVSRDDRQELLRKEIMEANG